MRKIELIKIAESCGWQTLNAYGPRGPYIILKRGKYELSLEEDICNIMVQDKSNSSLWWGRGVMELSKAINPKPWIIGIFRPPSIPWFSLKTNRFLADRKSK